jgi:hypothetical protein
VLIDNFLQKATKADKKPHWCVEHQKWEAKDHDKGIEKAAYKAVSAAAPTAPGFNESDNSTSGLGKMNVHAEVVPITLDWNPFKRQKADPKKNQPSPEYRKIYPETEGDKLNRIVEASRQARKDNKGFMKKVMERPEEDDDPYGHKEAHRNPASIAQRWEGGQAKARMKEIGETGGTDVLGPIGRNAPPGFEDEAAKQKQEQLSGIQIRSKKGGRGQEVVPPTGNRLNAIENSLLKLMKAEPEEEDVDAYLEDRMKGDEQTYHGEEAVGFPVMPTDYLDVADDPEHWRHSSPHARPKRVNIVDEGSHPSWETAPSLIPEARAGIEAFPERAGEPHSDTPGKWPTLIVPKKQAYERDEEPPTPKSYQPKGKPEYMGRGNVKNSIENSLLKIMKYGSDMEKAPAAPREEGVADRMAAEMAGAGDEGGQMARQTASGIAEGIGGLFGQAASGQGKVQQYYADEAQRRMEDAKKGGTSDTDTAGDPQQTGLMGNTGATANQPAGGGANTPEAPKVTIPSAFPDSTVANPPIANPQGSTPPGETEISGTQPGEIPKPKGTQIPTYKSMKKAFGIHSK